jgi:hypothetical protein
MKPFVEVIRKCLKTFGFVGARGWTAKKKAAA